MTGDPTLNIVGRYTVSQLSAYGSLLTLTGAGQLDSPLWLMGSMVVGQGGRGTLELESEAQFRADRLIVGRSALENRVTASGQDTLLGVTGELVVGDGGLGILQLRQGAQGVVRRHVVGRQSKADNRALIEGPETRLSGSDRIDVGEQSGRGRLEMVDTAEARPGAGLSVGIYDGSDGMLLLDRKAFIVTSADAIFGGGVDSRAAATIRGGGSLDALDILIFAKPSGSATLDVTNQFSSIEAVRDLQIGFGRGPAGTTRMRADDGAFVSAGESLMVGVGGRFEVTGARVKVGAAEFPPPGTVRVGTGGRLRGSGRVKARVEVVAGGVVSPGSSPGTLTVEGNYAQQASARLEIEISGTAAGTARMTSFRSPGLPLRRDSAGLGNHRILPPAPLIPRLHLVGSVLL